MITVILTPEDRHNKIGVICRMYEKLTNKEHVPVDEFDYLCDIPDEGLFLVEKDIQARLDMLDSMQRFHQRLMDHINKEEKGE